MAFYQHKHEGEIHELPQISSTPAPQRRVLTALSAVRGSADNGTHRSTDMRTEKRR